MLRIALVVLVILSACATPMADPTADGRVVEIIDGDTLVISVGGRRATTRLIGIDTPETKKPDTPVECFGPEATEFLRTLVPPTTSILVRRDIEGRDHFGRILTYVFRAEDGLFVNREILLQGYARALPIPPNTTFARDFADVAARARQERRGMWQCDSVTS